MLQVCKENFCLYSKIPVKIDQTVRIRTAGYPAALLHFPCYYKQIQQADSRKQRYGGSYDYGSDTYRRFTVEYSYDTRHIQWTEGEYRKH